ncbi:MAG: 50S ribosomal protein L10 [Candidatus Micrarchaeota archaeon]|nr:50S ribosomal protein L10 [Candidatus Micrarchaeota archaeon]
MMIKAQKVEFVKKMSKEAKGYRTIVIMSLDAVPDSLVQKVRNSLKPDVKFIVARKTLAMKILESDPRLEKLKDYTKGNFAILFSNKDPTELNKVIAANRKKLGAKPNQVSPADISIESGETSIMPGQAVTDLKSAGIDVKIEKGKVVISKSKVLVKKGDKISTAISKALKMLDIMPFEAGTKLTVALNGNLIYTERVLAVDHNYVTQEVAVRFAEANALATQIGLVTQYNVDSMVRKAYLSALGLGLGAEIYQPGITDKLLAKAVREALSLNGLVKEEPKEEKTEQKEEPKEA